MEDGVTVGRYYTYDYTGNRLSKTVNESSTMYYVNDTSGSLTQVVAETDKDGKETASYTRGDELLSMEKGGKIWYYIYDGMEAPDFSPMKRDASVTATLMMPAVTC